MAAFDDILLIFGGALAGFIDSIAGGGGLITIPILSLRLGGTGPTVIGTNKIVGAAAALVALLVYLRAGHVDWRKTLHFTLWIGIGSLSGSFVSPHLPKEVFRWLLLLTCPLILWVIWKRQLWVERAARERRPDRAAILEEMPLALSGLACGFYDGVWGPGGGTFMFLSLLFFARLPILTALAASKFANTVSALTALAGYASQGHVRILPGAMMAAGISVGSFIGARHASRNAAKIIRPILVIVVLLLVGRLLFQA